MISVEGVVVVRTAAERFLAELSVVVRLWGSEGAPAARWRAGGASRHPIQPGGRVGDGGTLFQTFPGTFPYVTLCNFRVRGTWGTWGTFFPLLSHGRARARRC